MVAKKKKSYEYTVFLSLNLEGEVLFCNDSCNARKKKIRQGFGHKSLFQI